MESRAFKTRFAPSPTGLLHLGNVRTALFNYLLASGRGGTFLLRLEDTDAVRGHEKYAQALQDDLRWLGLDWQEGPDIGGESGPYLQSQRSPVYDRYFAALEERGLAYRCFCSEYELEVARKTQLAAGRPPRYSGRCHGLTAAEVEARLKTGTPATLRFHVADGQTVEFEDQVRGHQVFRTSDIGDFVIRRSDGTPAFFFSNAIDDALMGVTLVVRGEDHLTNTPRQILMLRALGVPVPNYAHIALVVGVDGTPLSKRTGSRSVQELREAGFLPLAINNYLARLGHTYDDNALMDVAGLARAFSIGRLHRAPSHFDETQLLHWQKEALLRATDDELWKWMSRGAHPEAVRIEMLVPAEETLGFVRTIRDNVTVPGDALFWAGALFAEEVRYEHEAATILRAAGGAFFRAAIGCLDRGRGDDFKSYASAVGEAAGVKGKALFMPLRAALTGTTHGPEMERLWRLLGVARVRRRLADAAARC